jgi:hypothetical protein
MSRANPRYRRTNVSGTAVTINDTIVEYIIQGSIEGQLTVNTFYYHGIVTVPTFAQLTTLLTNISLQVFSNMRTCVSADWSCTRELLNVVDVSSIQGVISVANAGVLGTRPATHLPTEVAAVLIRRTTLKGQHGRGRVSLPAISPGDVTASTITLAAEKTALAALASAMLFVCSDGTNNYTPVVAQRSPAPPRLVTNYTNITSVTPNYVLGTVRRRKLGRGK